MKSFKANHICKSGRSILICCLSMLLLSHYVMAHKPYEKHIGTDKPGALDNRWSLETSITFPMARIYMLKLSYKHSERAELGFGPAFQNWKNLDDSPQGRANAYTLVLSCRYYFWRNFNTEIEFWPAWNYFESFVDGKTYKGPELWVEYKVGYKWDFAHRFYLNIQPGIGHALWLQKEWPGVNKKPYGQFVKGSVIFVPQVLLGWVL
jgi:hypothetical protein